MNQRQELTFGVLASEELIFDTVTTGASNDMEKATKIARAMIAQYGMSEKFGLMSLESVENQYLSGRTVLDCSDRTAAEVDDEVKALLKECYSKAQSILADNREVLDKIAEFLFEKETITGKEFMEIYNRIKNPQAEDLKEEEEVQQVDLEQTVESVDNSENV